MSRQIGLRALRSFQAIVKTGSVTAAARQMGLTQPAVSRLLAQLEEAIGFELFHRDRGRLVPTADGLILFDEVDMALGGVDRVYGLVRDIADFRVGQLKLVAPPSFSEGVLPDIVTAFLGRFPDIHLTIESRSVETAKSMIANRTVDGGFVKLPLDRPDLRPEKVVTSETVCVIPRGHALAAHDILDPATLRSEPLILLGLGRSSRAQVEAAFAEAGVRPNVRVETHTIGSACGLAARGVGIAIVNELLARSYIRNATVVRSFAPRMAQDYAFVTSALTAPTRLAQEFLAQTLAYFAEQPVRRL